MYISVWCFLYRSTTYNLGTPLIFNVPKLRSPERINFLWFFFFFISDWWCCGHFHIGLNSISYGYLNGELIEIAFLTNFILFCILFYCSSKIDFKIEIKIVFTEDLKFFIFAQFPRKHSEQLLSPSDFIIISHNFQSETLFLPFLPRDKKAFPGIPKIFWILS